MRSGFVFIVYSLKMATNCQMFSSYIFYPQIFFSFYLNNVESYLLSLFLAMV